MKTVFNGCGQSLLWLLLCGFATAADASPANSQPASGSAEQTAGSRSRRFIIQPRLAVIMQPSLKARQSEAERDDNRLTRVGQGASSKNQHRNVPIGDNLPPTDARAPCERPKSSLIGWSRSAGEAARARHAQASPLAEEQRVNDRNPTGGNSESAEPSRTLASDPVSLNPQPNVPREGVPPLETPVGWQAVGQRLAEHLRNYESLLKRNAFYSAREEAVAAMLHLVRRLDQAENRLYCEPAFLAAKQAFEEADDFSVSQQRMPNYALLQQLVTSHQTPVLKQADLDSVSPRIAAQHYRSYGEQALCDASRGHPWASELLCAIGRSYQAEAGRNAGGADELLMRAVAYFRAALRVLPTNARAASQLGRIMLQMDRPLEARGALLAAVSTHPSETALRNLVEAARRLDDQPTQSWAAQQLAILESKTQRTANIPQIVEVDPRVFAALSPRTSGPAAAQASSSAPAVAAAGFGGNTR